MALQCPNTEFVAFADIYTRRLEEARKLAPAAKTYLDYRYLLDDKSIDAVLIATPQHLHCEHFVAALDAGKHVYQEKTMAFTVEHAKRMRAAYQKAGKRTVQIGHGGCSSGSITDAMNFVKTGYLGKITEVHAHHYRNTPHGRPQWSRPVLPDMTAENIIWKSFLGEAPQRPFDPNRYINWRFFWDYAGGNFYENMCHQLASWYKVLNLQIPQAVTAVGGVYLWKDGREVPDTMCAAMEHPEELLFNWTSGFGNNEFGSSVEVLGTDGTINDPGRDPVLSPEGEPAGRNRDDGQDADSSAGAHAELPGLHRRRQGTQLSLRTGIPGLHRLPHGSRQLRQRRTLRWDPNKEEIV